MRSSLLGVLVGIGGDRQYAVGVSVRHELLGSKRCCVCVRKRDIEARNESVNGLVIWLRRLYEYRSCSWF